MSRKVCVVTGTRAEYGLLRRLMRLIADEPLLSLQVIATGMHLSPEFGLTFREIEGDGFSIDRKIEILLSSDTPVSISKSIALGMISFAEAFQQMEPDIVVLLGDRFETFAAASAATMARLPILHIHGGERTEGAVDEALRHAITKMSHLHCVAAAEYVRRVIQLGELPERVFMVGGLGVDGIQHECLLSRAELEASLGFKLKSRNLLITYHPVTLEEATASQQVVSLLDALDGYDDLGLIFTLPNADADGRAIIPLIEDFVRSHPNAMVAASLGQLRYLSCLSLVDGVVGNSSSGLLEAPSLHTGTINIGDRQRGRLQASSVINCRSDAIEIRSALERLFSSEFQESLVSVENPYGNGGASERILRVLKTSNLAGIIKKQFYDLSSVHPG